MLSRRVTLTQHHRRDGIQTLRACRLFGFVSFLTSTKTKCMRCVGYSRLQASVFHRSVMQSQDRCRLGTSDKADMLSRSDMLWRLTICTRHHR